MTMRTILAIILLTFGTQAEDRTAVADPLVLKLWDGVPPGNIGDAGPETKFPQWPETVANVSVPTMTVYRPPQKITTGIAVVYCSGGSYNKVSAVSDSVGNAEYFTAKGVTLIVVKYRTSPPAKGFSAALADAKRAVRIVRHRAKEWDIAPHKVGMLGGSAGGNLILNVATHWDLGRPDAADVVERASCRPDFIAALCPWPNRQSLADLPIAEDTPPALICAAHDDQIAPSSFAEEITAAYKSSGVASHLWVIERGGHTAFSNMQGATGAAWIDHFWAFLEEIRITAK